MTSYAVVGAGLAGAATAWQLARRGHPVTLLERTTPANPQGSSHGSARIFRYAYPDPFYAGLVRRARDDWDELEAAAGRRLIRPVDAVDFGELRDIPRLAATLAEVGVKHQVLSAEQARERWPQIGFDTPVLRHAGGVIDAETAVGSLVELAVAAGADLRTGWPVASIRPSTGSGVLLTSATGDQVSADQLVIAAGGWLPGLVGDLVPLPPLRIQQEQVFHFPYQETVSGESRWPTVIHKSAAIQVYGLPGDRDAGFAGQKVAEYFGGRALAGAEQADGVVDPANRERVTDYVRRYLPGLVPEPYAESTCLFTTTPTEDFVIDRVGPVTVLSACSGHGAKFAPLLGRIAADVAEGRPGPAQFTLPVRP